MNDEDFLQSLINEYGRKQRKSHIRSIANAIYDFLEEYHIDLNPMERERLSLYLVHYINSTKAAAHICPIHPGIRKIPNSIQKIASIIDEATDAIADQDLMNQDQRLDEELKQTLNDTPICTNESTIEIRTHRRKLSKIQSFNKKSQEEKDNKD
ncbi:MAG: hypothetical protein QCI00_01405 [Candidatus Thermoplasmatota archaeon]|nr:hypothetical protein [Candidatus Thermoplasmatota archaeon]